MLVNIRRSQLLCKKLKIKYARFKHNLNCVLPKKTIKAIVKAFMPLLSEPGLCSWSD